MTYEDARKYVEQLKAEKFACYENWRLPTVEELLSLVEKTRENGDLFISPKFDERQSWCWSNDKRSSSVVWIVDFSNGRVYWDLLVYKYYVRAGRSWH